MSKSRTFEWERKNPEKKIWNAARLRSKKKSITFSIDVSDITIPTHCPVLDIPITGRGLGLQPGSASLDRMVPELGYVKGNIRVISNRANHLKSNATVEELEKILEDARSIRHRERSSDTEQGS